MGPVKESVPAAILQVHGIYSKNTLSKNVRIIIIFFEMKFPVKQGILVYVNTSGKIGPDKIGDNIQINAESNPADV